MQIEQLKRLIVVLVVVFAVVVSASVLLLGGKDTSAEAHVARPPPIRSTAAGENENKAYRRLLEQQNRDHYEQAREQGQSMVATLSGAHESEPQPEPPPPAPAPALIIPTLPSPPETVRQSSASMAQEIRNIMDTWRMTPHEVVLVQHSDSAQAAANPAQGTANSALDLNQRHTGIPRLAANPAQGIANPAQAAANSTQSPNTASDSQAIVLRAGSLLYASLQTAINSDHPGVVLARVLGGRWDGMQLIGSFRRTHNRVVLEFNRASLPGGRTLEGLLAVAIDSKSSLPALKGKVDYHILHGYILPAAARFASSLGQSIARGRQTTLHGPLGNSTVISERQGLGEQLGAAGAEIGAGLLSDLAGRRRPPTVRVPAGHAFSVLVLQDLRAGNGEKPL